MVWFWCIKLFVIIKLCCCSLCKYRSNVDKIWQVPFCKVDLLFLRLKIVWQPVKRTLPLIIIFIMRCFPRFLKTSAMSQVGFNPKLVNLSSVSMSTVTRSLRHIISELWFTTVGKCNLRWADAAGSNLCRNKIGPSISDVISNLMKLDIIWLFPTPSILESLLRSLNSK